MWGFVDVCIDFGIVASRLGVWTFNSSRWYGLRRQHLNYLLSGLRYYLFFNPYRSSQYPPSFRFDVSVDTASSIDASSLEPCGVDEASCFAMLFFLLPPANTLLSFLLPPIQLFFLLLTTRVVLLLDPYCPWCFYSCRCWYSSLLVLCLDAVDIQEGFSFRVGCSTNRTQYLFCGHHFFLAKYSYSIRLYSSRCRCFYRLDSPNSYLVSTLLMLVILYID